MSTDKENAHRLNRLVLVLDVAIVIVCALISNTFHPLLHQWFPWVKAGVPVQHQLILFLLWLPLWGGLLVSFEVHCIFERRFNTVKILIDLIKIYGIGLVAISVIAYGSQLELNRSLVAFFLGLSFILTFLVHLAITARLTLQYKNGIGRTNMLLVGEWGDSMAEFVSRVQSHKYAPNIKGRISPVTGQGDVTSYRHVQAETPVKVVGTTDDFSEYLHVAPVDEVFFFEPFNNPSENIERLHTCEELGVPAYFAVAMDKPTESPPRFSMHFDNPFVLFDVSPKRQDFLAIKYAIDWLAALMAILLFLPVFAITAIVVAATMGRPVLFMQKRAGRFGREFRMIKFRTMKIGAEKQRNDLLDVNEMDGPVFKVTNDPRVTPVGAFLRRFSIDELPQLFNVLNGTMSLVGPRPLPVDEQKGIKGWRRRRLSMKPGITCIWQVSGRNDVSFEEWMKMDLDYIDRWSLWLDVKLLFKTIGAVLTSRGAR